MRTSSVRQWINFGIILGVGIYLLSLPAYAGNTTNSTSDDSTKTVLLYPRTDEIFSPRIYGTKSATDNVVLMISPGNDQDEKLFLDLYPRLQPLVAKGDVRLEIKLWGHIQGGLPYFLVAQCLEPNVMPLYLYEVFRAGPEARYNSPLDLESLSVMQALGDPQLTPDGLTGDEFHRRLNWCLSKRQSGMIYSETSRFNSIYNWALKNSGVYNTAAVVNQKIFDGNVEADAVMNALGSNNP